MNNIKSKTLKKLVRFSLSLFFVYMIHTEAGMWTAVGFFYSFVQQEARQMERRSEENFVGLKRDIIDRIFFQNKRKKD